MDRQYAEANISKPDRTVRSEGEEGHEAVPGPSTEDVGRWSVIYEESGNGERIGNRGDFRRMKAKGLYCKGMGALCARALRNCIGENETENLCK